MLPCDIRKKRRVRQVHSNEVLVIGRQSFLGFVIIRQTEWSSVVET
jgi:hypothetical protein